MTKQPHPVHLYNRIHNFLHFAFYILHFLRSFLPISFPLPAHLKYFCARNMKARTLKKDKVNIITLGCSKNLVDSEVLSGQLAANDIDVVHENRKLDHNIVVVNTCGFIDKAKEESINTILDQVELKRKGKLDKVYVTGCLSERYK